MIANWVHIVIVHFAIIGTPWLLYRVFTLRQVPMDTKSWKDTFSWLIVLAIITGIAYFTGPETADWTKQVLKPYPQDQVEDHGFWGRVVFVIHGITGLIGVMGWSSILQEEKPDRRIYVFLLALLIVNTLIILYTAHLGGMIRRVDLM